LWNRCAECDLIHHLGNLKGTFLYFLVPQISKAMYHVAGSDSISPLYLHYIPNGYLSHPSRLPFWTTRRFDDASAHPTIRAPPGDRMGMGFTWWNQISLFWDSKLW
jgi:hypothetical protein